MTPTGCFGELLPTGGQWAVCGREQRRTPSWALPCLWGRHRNHCFNLHHHHYQYDKNHQHDNQYHYPSPSKSFTTIITIKTNISIIVTIRSCTPRRGLTETSMSGNRFTNNRVLSVSALSVSVSYNSVKLTLQYFAVFQCPCLRIILGHDDKSLIKFDITNSKTFLRHVRVLKENIKDNYEHSYDICYQCKDYGGRPGICQKYSKDLIGFPQASHMIVIPSCILAPRLSHWAVQPWRPVTPLAIWGEAYNNQISPHFDHCQVGRRCFWWSAWVSNCLGLGLGTFEENCGEALSLSVGAHQECKTHK